MTSLKKHPVSSNAGMWAIFDKLKQDEKQDVNIRLHNIKERRKTGIGRDQDITLLGTLGWVLYYTVNW